jgi:hypothetical protein
VEDEEVEFDEEEEIAHEGLARDSKDAIITSHRE